MAELADPGRGIARLRSRRCGEAVRDDVRQGYVSVEAAADLSGVVVDPVTGVRDEQRRAVPGRILGGRGLDYVRACSP